MVLAAEHVIDEGDVEVEHGGIFGLKFARLGLDDDIAC
jgi:hypothetical protein